MLKFKEKFALFSLSVFVIIFSYVEFEDSKAWGTNHGEARLSINLKAKAVVIGPAITLGDIGQVIVSDSIKRLRLAAVKVGKAPPPGESSEISRNHIKRCLKKSGFGEFIDVLEGPRIIRVTTAQVEIDKAFIKEQYAKIFRVIVRQGCLTKIHINS
ncbi:hypothetical protein GWO43_03490 [candidate division KSB1 bacterium]|nr:hypothetical protein [candidate division KSB1 bacterium]NIR70405.1 hypothetical protein [candidate division KSB1 bacterium]NIS25945.1 hypothetical protein [candidate division KSB1 bacterium]NIT69968.1 hypothetical protein [candidate division KSB1 bacterium]NIU26633.1 hypothetical protein [candidate division KSB1 bacterium]